MNMGSSSFVILIHVCYCFFHVEIYCQIFGQIIFFCFSISFYFWGETYKCIYSFSGSNDSVNNVFVIRSVSLLKYILGSPSYLFQTLIMEETCPFLSLYHLRLISVSRYFIYKKKSKKKTTPMELQGQTRHCVHTSEI